MVVKRYVLDIETNGLLDQLTKIHCLALYDLDTDEVLSFADQPGYISIEAGLEVASAADLLVTQNGIRFDFPAIAKVRGWAERVEHLVRPRILGLTGGRFVSFFNGGLVIAAVLLLMAPIPLVPFVNSLPALAIILLCFGMAERDGAVILLGYLMTAVSAAYVGGLVLLVFYAGMRHEEAVEAIRAWFN